MQTLERTDAAQLADVAAPASVPTCGACGAVSAPDGACFDVGTCERADALATRGASRETSKYAVPAAWNAAGRVD